jgi:hypothetical protein
VFHNIQSTSRLCRSVGGLQLCSIIYNIQTAHRTSSLPCCSCSVPALYLMAHLYLLSAMAGRQSNVILHRRSTNEPTEALRVNFVWMTQFSRNRFLRIPDRREPRGNSARAAEQALGRARHCGVLTTAQAVVDIARQVCNWQMAT